MTFVSRFNSAESNLADGTATTVANSGGTAGDAWSQAPSIGASSSVTVTTTNPVNGSRSYRSTAAVSEVASPVWTYPAATRFVMGYFEFNAADWVTAPTVSRIIYSARIDSTHGGRIGINTARKIFIQNGGTTVNTFATALPTTGKIGVALTIDLGTTTSDGTIDAQYYVNGAAVDTVYGATGLTISGGATTFTNVQFGSPIAVAEAKAFNFDTVTDRYGATADIGSKALLTPPTTALSATASTSGVTTVAVGSSVALTGAAAGGTPGYTYAWTKVSSLAGSFSSTTAQNPSYTPSAAGTHTLRLTVTDAASTTATFDVSFAASGTVPFTSVSAPTYTNVGAAASLLAAINDVDDATYAETVDNPTNAVFDGVLSAMSAPTADFTVTGRFQKNGAGICTFTAQLYDTDGTTLLATASASVVAGSSVAAAQFTFLAANISSIASSKWVSGGLIVRVKCTVT